MTDHEIALFTQLAKGIAQQFGDKCEVLVHDLSATDVEKTVIAIENGHISGRHLGDGPSQIVWEALQADPAALQDRLAYLTKTKDGKLLRSSTIFLRNASGKPMCIFSINYDITMMKALESTIHSFVTPVESGAVPETITNNVNDLLDELINQSIRLVGKHVSMMNKEDKVRAIRYLYESGAFLITRAAPTVCSHFNISKFTLYSYIKEVKEEKGELDAGSELKED